MGPPLRPPLTAGQTVKRPNGQTAKRPDGQTARRSDGQTGQANSASTWTSTLPRSAFDTGQLASAASTASRNWASSAPGTVAVTCRRIVVIVGGSKTATADNSRRDGSWPRLDSSFESAMPKQAAWAAASSSSGLVRPPASSVREAHVTGASVNSPVLSADTVPAPLKRSPSQTALALRSATSSLSLAGSCRRDPIVKDVTVVRV